MRSLVSLSLVCGVLLGCRTRTPAVPPAPPQAAEGFLTLFDGTKADGWVQAGAGRFVVAGGVARSEGGKGLWYFAGKKFRDFELEVEYRVESAETNSGVVVRFEDLPAALGSPMRDGYEVQILGEDASPYTTGAIYSFEGPKGPPPLRPAGEWNTLRVSAVGQDYEVHVNGTPVTRYVGKRRTEGLIGLQNQSAADKVEFRKVRVRER